MFSAQASQEAAGYLSALSAEFQPEVVEDFRDKVVALDRDPEDRTDELRALIEGHDVANEPRTAEALTGVLRRLAIEDGEAPQDEAAFRAAGGKAD